MHRMTHCINPRWDGVLLCAWSHKSQNVKNENKNRKTSKFHRIASTQTPFTVNERRPWFKRYQKK